jgi:hypothetical protein
VQPPQQPLSQQQTLPLQAQPQMRCAMHNGLASSSASSTSASNWPPRLHAVPPCEREVPRLYVPGPNPNPSPLLQTAFHRGPPPYGLGAASFSLSQAPGSIPTMQAQTAPVPTPALSAHTPTPIAFAPAPTPAASAPVAMPTPSAPTSALAPSSLASTPLHAVPGLPSSSLALSSLTGEQKERIKRKREAAEHRRRERQPDEARKENLGRSCGGRAAGNCPSSCT